jgi:hypothetical protein
MKDLFVRFLKRISVLSALLGVLSVVLFFALPHGAISPLTPWLVLFFFAATSGLYYFLLQSVQQRFAAFINRFMIITVAKMLLYIIIIVMYSFLNTPDMFPFVFAFLILYLIYTVFEVTCFVQDQKYFEK